MDNTNNIIYPEYGLRDNIDDSTGLTWGKSDKKIITRNNLIFCDSRDCIGQQSIRDAQTVFVTRGGRGEISGNISTTTGLNVSPIVITTIGELTDEMLRDGDRVNISRVQGNTSANGNWRIQNVVLATPGTFELAGSIGNGNYSGGGMYIKPADNGYPQVTDNESEIINNCMTIKLEKKLKVIRSLSLIHAILPRDIIPLQVYLPDFIEFTQFGTTDIPTGPQVRVASTANQALLFFGLPTIDGVALNLLDRVLLKDQAAPTENGVYFISTFLFFNVLSRADDFTTGLSATSALGYYVTATEGTVNANTSWVVTATGPGAIGTDPNTWATYTGTPISWASYIPQEKISVEFLSLGFYSSPIHLFRTYFNGSFVLPNQHTPPPLKLWNPTVGGATHQLQPYPYQVVPIYTSDVFSVTGRTGDFYLICSGYGLYDLNDWTYGYLPVVPLTTPPNFNRIVTSVIRLVLLFAIVNTQSYRDVDYIELIANSATTSNDTASLFYGYGDFQRFLPGPGLGMHYQPGTSDGADPTIVRADSPVPFPCFRGNVWGPYNSPGDRFQRMGVRDCLQDLYLNGDMANLFGSSIVKPGVGVRDIPTDSTFGLYFQAFIPVTFGNIQDSTNPNVLNAMRLTSNGYGAMTRTALGNSQTYTRIYMNAGGQGPSRDGLPVTGYSAVGTGDAWVNNEVLDPAGTGEFRDEIAAGPGFAPDGVTTMTAEAADADYTGDEVGVGDAINRRTAWYDLGACNGKFINELEKYRSWATKELPDTNLVMRVFQAERDNRIQSTNENTMNCIFSCPIRLNLGSTSGTQEYVENIHAFLASSHEYWEKRFLSPLQSLHKLSIKFTTYEGIEIPLERMLQPRRSVILLQQFQRVFGSGNFDTILDAVDTSIPLSFLFDPLDPRLAGREKRNLSLIFRVETYEYESPGLYLNMVKDMLEADVDQDENNEPHILKASNYESYL